VIWSARWVSKRSHASEVQEFSQFVGPPSTSRFRFVQRLRGGGFKTRTPTVVCAERETFVGYQQEQLGFAGLVAQG
jgi:glycerophosphoryl diester phosphodiesterase